MAKAKPELTSMAEAIGIDIRTLTNWRKRDGFPHEGTIEEVKAWSSAQGLGRIRDGSTLAELKAQMMRRDIEIRDLKIARERAEVVETEVVRAMLKTLAHKMDMLLRLKLEVESGQRFLGKNAAEICAEGRLMHDEIREVLANNIANFETEAIKETIQDSDLDDNE